jgi:hypothetical protein
MSEPSTIWTSVIPAITGLAGTIIGGLIGYYSQRAQHKAYQSERRIALAAAIRAELEAYLSLMALRDHGSNVRAIIERLRKGEDISLKALPTNDTKLAESFPVFFSQLGHIGLLGDCVGDLAKFYSQMAGVRATLDMMHAGRFDQLRPQDRARPVEQDLELWENTLQLGRAICGQLASITK